MQHVDQRQWILSGFELIHDRDDQLVKDCIDGLRVDNWRGLIMSQDQTVIPGGIFTETEQWYGTEYHVADVPSALLEVMRTDMMKFDLNFERSICNFDTRMRSLTIIYYQPCYRDWHTFNCIQNYTSQSPTNSFLTTLRRTNLHLRPESPLLLLWCTQT